MIILAIFMQFYTIYKYTENHINVIGLLPSKENEIYVFCSKASDSARNKTNTILFGIIWCYKCWMVFLHPRFDFHLVSFVAVAAAAVVVILNVKIIGLIVMCIFNIIIHVMKYEDTENIRLFSHSSLWNLFNAIEYVMCTMWPGAWLNKMLPSFASL